MKSARFPAQPSRRAHHLSRPITRWQRICLSLYAALFTGVLPFICLGALGEPGHPHRFPHFVFAMPVMAMSHSVATSAIPVSKHGRMRMGQGDTHSDTHSNTHRPAPQPDQALDDKTNAASPVAACPIVDGTVPGRATTTLMIFAILLLIFFESSRIDPWAVPHFCRHHLASFLKSVTVSVPLPPPRRLAQS